MLEIECVRADNAIADKYLKKLISEVASEAKFIEMGNAHINQNAPLIILATGEHLAEIKKLINSREVSLIIALNARKDFKLVSELKMQFDKIFGFIDLSQEVEYNVPLMKNYLNMNFSKHAVKLDKLAGDLEKVYEFTKSELFRIKDLHDRFVRVRVDTLKGVTVTSKFAAGEKSGGEFFDILQTDQSFLFVQAGSDNYIVSSLILSEMEVLKLSTPTTTLKMQSEHFEKMIIQHAKEHNAELSYCIVNVDIKTLTAECKFRGDGRLYFDGELIDYSKSVILKIKPSEKMYFLSMGALRNLTALNPELSVKNFYKENVDKNTRDLINEFFFEVSRNKAGNFLIYDALMTAIEVDQKTLYKI
jgi:hypothetical protein